METWLSHDPGIPILVKLARDLTPPVSPPNGGEK